MPAPKNPCSARQKTICSMVEAKPQKKLAMVKPEAEIANSIRVPNARDRNPQSGIAITSAIRYEVCTHETSLELAERPAWISLSDAETIWMSRIDMNIPNTMMRNANSRFGGIRSASAAVGFIIPGGAVVTFAMSYSAAPGFCPAPKITSRKLLGMGHLGRVEIGFAVGIVSALARVDGGVDRHARAQQVLPGDILRHADAHRQPLHDLCEIAGGVVRRQQCEHRARGRRDAVDHPGEFAEAVGIDLDRHRLAGTDALELRLFIVSVDEHLVERHQIAEPLTGLDHVADIEQAI